MYTVKTNLTTLTNEIIDTKPLPVGTVCKFMDNMQQATEELENREMYKSVGCLDIYIKDKGWDF